MNFKKASLLVGLAALVAAGCGSGDTATAAEADAFKNRDKNSIKAPPADAFKPPANFSSSISSNGPGGPPAGGTGK